MAGGEGPSVFTRTTLGGSGLCTVQMYIAIRGIEQDVSDETIRLILNPSLTVNYLESM